MGRPRKSGRRTAKGKLSQSADALAERNPPNDRVKALRKLFAFVTPVKGPDGRGGEIDQDICDAIGQLHALGLLDGHGLDPTELRDRGREWGAHYAKLLRKSGYKTGGYERMDKGVQEVRLTGADMAFDRMDENLRGVERSTLLSLIVDPIVGSWPDGEEMVPWARAIICEALLKRGKLPPSMRFPSPNDKALLDAAIRGLCILVDGALPRRWEQRRVA